MRLGISVIIILLGFQLFAQRRLGVNEIRAGAFVGNMLNIYPNTPLHTRQTGAFVDLSFHSIRDIYANAWKNPVIGYSVSYHNLGNNQILGNAVGVQKTIQLEQRIGADSSHFSIRENFGLGGLIVSKHYDVHSNPTNIVFGSSLSALVSVGLGIHYAFKRNSIGVRFDYWHSSNGHTVLPNVGMNTPTLSLNYAMSFDPKSRMKSTPRIKVIEELKSPKWRLLLYGGIGINEAGGTVRPTNAPSYRKQIIALGGTYRYSAINRVQITLEGYHDATYALWNNVMQWNPDHLFLGSSALMLMAGHEFVYGRFGVLIQMGLNIYNPTLHRLIGEVERPTTSNTLKSIIPGRFAARYYVVSPDYNSTGLFVQAAVKSNMGQADFLEFGIGTLIGKKKAESE